MRLAHNGCGDTLDGQMRDIHECKPQPAHQRPSLQLTISMVLWRRRSLNLARQRRENPFWCLSDLAAAQDTQNECFARISYTSGTPGQPPGTVRVGCSGERSSADHRIAGPIDQAKDTTVRPGLLAPAEDAMHAERLSSSAGTSIHQAR